MQFSTALGSSAPQESSKPATTSPNEAFLLLANGARGAAAVALVRQVLEAPTVFVFGEIIDHPNIQALQSFGAEGEAFLKLLHLFAFGTYRQYLEEKSHGGLPDITDLMARKLRLLTLASLATRDRLLRYDLLQVELGVDSVRKLEDLVIEASSHNVVQGKLDQKSRHFEVDFAMARDIRKDEVSSIAYTLGQWCSSCDTVLSCLEAQVARANDIKVRNWTHKASIEKKAAEIRSSLKTQQQLNAEGTDDPDSRMDPDRVVDRKTFKAKGKGLRGSVKGGFWQK